MPFFPWHAPVRDPRSIPFPVAPCLERISARPTEFLRLRRIKYSGSQLYPRGMAEFQAGDYAKAAADLEALLAKAEFTPQLEPAFFTLGSAYFNAGDYKKAVAAFKNYQTKFPNGAHSAEVAFAIAQSSLLGKNYAEAAAEFAKLEKDPRLREAGALFRSHRQQGRRQDRRGHCNPGKTRRRTD